MRPDRALQKLWAEVGEAIDSGEIRGVFVVMQFEGQMPAYDSALRSPDVDDLLLQVRSEWIKVRGRQAREETTN